MIPRTDICLVSAAALTFTLEQWPQFVIDYQLTDKESEQMKTFITLLSDHLLSFVKKIE